MEVPGPWIDLKGACALKGIRYHSVCPRKNEWRRPNGGKEDGILNGRRYWRPETVAEWIMMTDKELAENYRDRCIADVMESVINEAEDYDD